MKFVFADMVTSMAPAIGRRPGVANLRAAQIANSLIREYPQVPDYRALKAKTLLARGDKIAIEDAVRMMQSLVDDFPAITSYRFVLANGLQRLARMDVDANRTREAKESLDRAIKILESSSTVEDRSPVINAYANRIRQELKEIP